MWDSKPGPPDFCWTTALALSLYIYISDINKKVWTYAISENPELNIQIQDPICHFHHFVEYG